MIDIKELLEAGYSIEEIMEITKKELDSEIAAKEREEMAKAAENKRQETLSDARAHLISAIGLYNEVFNFCEFNDAEACALADALVELEEFVTNNRSLVDMYIKVAEDSAKPSKKAGKDKPLTTYNIWKMLGF